MLLLELIVELVFLLFLSLSKVLFSNLPIELVLDQPFSLLFSHERLFLLFIVKDGVEVLNGSPLILLVQIGKVVHCVGSRLCVEVRPE